MSVEKVEPSASRSERAGFDYQDVQGWRGGRARIWRDGEIEIMEDHPDLEGFKNAAKRQRDADAVSERGTSEPVAWQWRLKGQGQWGPWKAIKCEDYAVQYFRTAQLQRGSLDAQAYEVRPLYAAPLPAERNST